MIGWFGKQESDEPKVKLPPIEPPALLPGVERISPTVLVSKHYIGALVSADGDWRIYVGRDVVTIPEVASIWRSDSEEECIALMAASERFWHEAIDAEREHKIAEWKDQAGGAGGGAK